MTSFLFAKTNRPNYFTHVTTNTNHNKLGARYISSSPGTWSTVLVTEARETACCTITRSSLEYCSSREGQPTGSTHGFQQNLAGQLGEPNATYEGAEVAAPRNQALPPTHVCASCTRSHMVSSPCHPLNSSNHDVTPEDISLDTRLLVPILTSIRTLFIPGVYLREQTAKWYCWGPFYWLFPGLACQAVTSPSALRSRRGDALPPWDLFQDSRFKIALLLPIKHIMIYNTDI